MTRKRSSSSRTSRAPKKGQLGLGGIVALVVLAVIALVQGGLKIGQQKATTAAPTSAVTPMVTPGVTPAVVTPQPTPGGTAVITPGGATPLATGIPALVPIPGGYDGGWFQLYFTAPINTTDESRFTGAPIENALVAAIDRATATLDMAIFELNSQPITDALIRAQQRGVTVRVVTDGEHGLENPDSTMDQVEGAGIQVVSDGTRSAFMHNKFVVIDGLYVWTGSTNFTHNDIYNNNNNSMLIRSSQLARNYTDEFNELFAKKFGPTSPNTIVNPTVVINGTPIETFFESEGNVPARLIELFNNAHTIRFMAFSFSRQDMIQALLTRAQSGQASIFGIVEASQRRFAKALFCAAIPNVQIRQDGNPDILHSKVFIIDDSIVVMGSFNFSAQAADQNDENTLIIHSADIARAYLEEFDRRWAEAITVPASTMQC